MKTLSLILLLSLIGCIPANDVFFIPYKVLKGTHYCIPSAAQPPLPENNVTFQFKTDGTWDFEWPGELFMSKIGGIYWLYPHQCSVRVGLQTNKDGSEWLMWYVYDVNTDEPRKWGKICDLQIGRTYEVSVGWLPGKYFISLDDIYIEVPTNFTPSFEPRGFDSPYYGGDPVAPHTWNVPIKMNEVL
jgi:hypothetical protein